MGLTPKKHLGKSLQDVRDTLHRLHAEFGAHICGEGGEFETFTTDCPLYKSRIIVRLSNPEIYSMSCADAQSSPLELDSCTTRASAPRSEPSVTDLARYSGMLARVRERERQREKERMRARDGERNSEWGWERERERAREGGTEREARQCATEQVPEHRWMTSRR